MRILTIQETDWLKRNPLQQHHLAEILSLRGHDIRVIDYEILWKTQGKRELYSKRETFESISSYWLDPQYPLKWDCLFVLPHWLKVWWQEFGADSNLYLHSVRQGDDLIGIAPLLVNNESAFFIGSPNVCDYLDFVVTSDEAGADKPKPPVFLAALERARVDASEAIHVGDQYKVDILGARGVGITPILIDRYGLCPEVSDCPRIHNLTELAGHLQ